MSPALAELQACPELEAVLLEAVLMDESSGAANRDGDQVAPSGDTDPAVIPDCSSFPPSD